MRVVKGIFVTHDGPFFFPVKCEMANFFLVNRDFHSSREAWFCIIIFRETRNKCLIRREPWFSLCLCYFRQPKWYCVTVTGRLIPVATTWLVWFSVTFGQSSFSSSVSSISTIMAEAHGRECPRWPRSSTRTKSLNGFTKPPSIRLVLFLWTCIRLLSTGENGREEGGEGAPTSRDPGDDQLSEYDDDSSDNDSDDFAVEEDGAIRDMQNEELGFLSLKEGIFKMGNL